VADSIATIASLTAPTRLSLSGPSGNPPAALSAWKNPIDVVDGRPQQALEERRRELAVRELDRIGPGDRLERLGGAGHHGEHVGHDGPGRVTHALERLRSLGS
jgi:hypothetical protein